MVLSKRSLDAVKRNRGIIPAGASIVKALTDEPPESWGIGKFILDANGQLQIDVVGQGSGRSQVQTQLQGTRNYLQGLIAQAQQSTPNAALGIIAQRTASITWREARQSDAGYAINDIDPITGQQANPYLRWDDNGLPFSSNPQVWQPDATDPAIRRSMPEQLLASALARQAIAPMWEVNTARIAANAPMWQKTA